VSLGKLGERGVLLLRIAQHRGDRWELGFEHHPDDLDLFLDELAGGLGEDGADRGSDHVGVALPA